MDSLSNVIGGLPLGEEFLLPEHVEEGGFTYLENEIDVLVLLIELIKLQTILVI